MSRTRTIVAFAIAVAYTTKGAASFAAEPDPKERVAALMSQAEEATASGRVSDALEALYSAWRLSPSFKIACNIGRLEFRRGEMRDAAEFLSICIDETPRTRTPEERARDARAANALAAALKHVAALVIEVNERGADVIVDDKPVGRSPLPRAVFVKPGPHRVTAKLEGRELAAVDVNGIEGMSSPMRLMLRSAAPPIIAPVGPARAPAEPVTAPVGSARAPATKPLGPVALAPEPVESGPPMLPLAMGGGALLSLGAGALFFALESSESAAVSGQSKSYQEMRGPCGRLPCDAADAWLKRDSLHDLSVASFTAAAGLTAGAIVIAVVSSKRTKKAAVSAATRGVTVARW